MKQTTWTLLSIFLASAQVLAAPIPKAACPTPKTLTYKVASSFVRSQKGFTQGLIMLDGVLVESTGAYGGTSVINRIDPLSGQVTQMAATPGNAFGEGLTALNGSLFQLTWREGKVFTYHPSKFSLLKTTDNVLGEGWGLTHNGKQLILSDGSNRLQFLNPKTLKEVSSVLIHDSKGLQYGNLNELEYVKGSVYANVFFSSEILRIDPTDGCVTGKLNLGGLWNLMTPQEIATLSSDPNHVLNGIAFDEKTSQFYVTGKNWPRIFSITISN